MGEPKIIHFDLDAFFCAVEELRRPELRNQPFAVGGQPGERGVVSSCSYAARQYGVRSAMPMGRAQVLCPNLIIVHSDYSVYRTASEAVMLIIRDLTPLVEQISIDEAFLDVSDLPQAGLEIAQNLQARIQRELQLPCSLGVASNKLVAKIATDFGKAQHKGSSYPNAITVVPLGEEAAFLAPLPTRMLWGVGPKTEARLAEMGIRTIGELASLPEGRLASEFGKYGLELARHARGISGSKIESIHVVKSISQETTFERDVADPARLRMTLQSLADQVAYRLRQHGLEAGTIRLKLRWPDFSTHTRQLTLNQPTDQDRVVYEGALELFNKLWSPGKAVRLLGVGASNLSERARQLSLWETSDEREQRLLEALDQLRERYGRQVVQRGRSLRTPKK
ncbi:MAG: DNA polymerase IV [Chloroflexi bacterium]|nr:DNA polymerase IV [Chloroflexota bacterium]